MGSLIGRGILILLGLRSAASLRRYRDAFISGSIALPAQGGEWSLHELQEMVWPYEEGYGGGC
jgi:hypothetical protein